MTAARMLQLAAILGAATVLLGAFGAHALKERLSPEALAWFETGVRYQMFHVLALLLCAVLGQRGPAPRASALCFLCGIVLFSGSLYALALTGQRWLGAVTPFGGLAFVAGWLLLLRHTRGLGREP